MLVQAIEPHSGTGDSLPIRSMYGIFTYTCIVKINQMYRSMHIPYMDPTGYNFGSFHGQPQVKCLQGTTRRDCDSLAIEMCWVRLGKFVGREILFCPRHPNTWFLEVFGPNNHNPNIPKHLVSRYLDAWGCVDFHCRNL